MSLQVQTAEKAQRTGRVLSALGAVEMPGNQTVRGQMRCQ